jgi:hypothetical protein
MKINKFYKKKILSHIGKINRVKLFPIMFHLHANSQVGTIRMCPLLQDKNQRDLKNKKKCTEFAVLGLTKGRGVLFLLF